MFRRPLENTVTSHGEGPYVASGVAHVPSKPDALTSATRNAADSGCSARWPNSVLAVFGAPAPVLPPMAM